MGAMGMIPALLTRTSTRPKPSTALWMSASTSPRFVTSVANPRALPPVPRSLEPLRRSGSNAARLGQLLLLVLRGASRCFANPAAGSGDYYNFAGDI